MYNIQVLCKEPIQTFVHIKRTTGFFFCADFKNFSKAFFTVIHLPNFSLCLLPAVPCCPKLFKSAYLGFQFYEFFVRPHILGFLVLGDTARLTPVSVLQG